MTGADVEMGAVNGDDGGSVGGVVGGAELVAFVEATAGSDDESLAAARRAALDVLGDEVVVDAAGVIGVFEMMNRLANGTGTPLDDDLVAPTENVVADLDLERFASSAESKAGGAESAT